MYMIQGLVYIYIRWVHLTGKLLWACLPFLSLISSPLLLISAVPCSSWVVTSSRLWVYVHMHPSLLIVAFWARWQALALHILSSLSLSFSVRRCHSFPLVSSLSVASTWFITHQYFFSQRLQLMLQDSMVRGKHIVVPHLLLLTWGHSRWRCLRWLETGKDSYCRTQYPDLILWIWRVAWLHESKVNEMVSFDILGNMKLDYLHFVRNLFPLPHSPWNQDISKSKHRLLNSPIYSQSADVLSFASLPQVRWVLWIKCKQNIHFEMIWIQLTVTFLES